MTTCSRISSSREELLYTNVPPSPAQIIEIQGTIASLGEDLRNIDLAINTISTPVPGGLLSFPKPPRYNDPCIILLHQLFRRKEELLEDLKIHAGLLNPVRRLPAELVQIIFRYCLPDDLPPLHPLEAPLLLCHICRGWRRLALTTPGLWSAISFDVPNVPSNVLGMAHLATSPIDLAVQTPGSSGALASVNLWLQSSHQTPLSFCFATTRDSSLSSRCFSALMSQSHRWQSAVIKIPVAGFVANLERSYVPMDALQSLRLEFFDGDPVGWDCFVQISRSAPQLRNLTILCDSFHFLRYQTTLEQPCAWNQLVRLDIFPTSTSPQYLVQLHDALDILRCTPNLVTCTLYMMNSRISSLPHVPDVVLEHLVSLHVATDQNLGYLLDRLVVPRIQDIQVDCTEDLFCWPHAEFVSLVTKAKSPITRFGVRSRTMKDDEFIECLQMMPELRCLELVMGGGVDTVNDRVLNLLTPSSHDGDCLLRQLKTFTLCVDGGDSSFEVAFSEEAFVEMISKRGYGPGNIRLCLAKPEARFTPENSKRCQDRLWKMMSDPRWDSLNVWKAYQADI